MAIVPGSSPGAHGLGEDQQVLGPVLHGTCGKTWCAHQATRATGIHAGPVLFSCGPQAIWGHWEPGVLNIANSLDLLSADVCDRAPNFLSPSGNQVLGPALGSVVTLNCTALVVSGPHCPPPSVQWLKDGLLLGNGSQYDLQEDSW